MFRFIKSLFGGTASPKVVSKSSSPAAATVQSPAPRPAHLYSRPAASPPAPGAPCEAFLELPLSPVADRLAAALAFQDEAACQPRRHPPGAARRRVGATAPWGGAHCFPRSESGGPRGLVLRLLGPGRDISRLAVGRSAFSVKAQLPGATPRAKAIESARGSARRVLLPAAACPVRSPAAGPSARACCHKSTRQQPPDRSACLRSKVAAKPAVPAAIPFSPNGARTPAPSPRAPLPVPTPPAAAPAPIRMAPPRPRPLQPFSARTELEPVKVALVSLAKKLARRNSTRDSGDPTGGIGEHTV